MKVTERREARSDLVKSGPLNVPRVSVGNVPLVATVMGKQKVAE